MYDACMSRGEGDPIELSGFTERPSSGGDTPASALRDMVARLVLDTTNEGIWLIDVQARTTFVNRAAAELLGYAEDEMIGMHVFELMEEERRPLARENLIRRQRGIEERNEVKLRRKNGTAIWVISSVNPVYDRNGQYAGALALFGDLTAPKRREAELHAQIDGLQRRLLDAQARPRVPASLSPAAGTTTYREPFRTAIVLGVLGCFAAVATVTAAGALLGAVVRRGPGAIDQAGA
jgi:PAS domain S-box-containing protein